jgi:hypothetical protein
MPDYTTFTNCIAGYQCSMALASDLTAIQQVTANYQYTA